VLGAVLLFLLGLGVLLYGAELLVRGASRLARSLGMSTLIVGLTVVSFGTSAPELAISVTSALSGNPELAVGNVVGSNIANVLLILGAAAVLATIHVKRQLLRFDVPIMVGAGLLMYLLALDGGFQRWEGILLFALSIAYTVFLLVLYKKQPTVEATADVDPVRPPWQNLALVIGGGVLLVLGSTWLVSGASTVAEMLGIDKLVVGLTIVAIGTSAPELATTAVAVMKGQRDLAVGNVVGSCIYNVFVVLGITAAVSPKIVPVPVQALRFDTPLMVIVLAACIPILFVGYRIFRWEGAMFLVCYAMYLAYLVVNSQAPESITSYSSAVLWIALPLVVVTATALTVNKVMKEKKEANSSES
jgi:cation:H+ antiporter